MSVKKRYLFLTAKIEPFKYWSRLLFLYNQGAILSFSYSSNMAARRSPGSACVRTPCDTPCGRRDGCAEATQARR